MTAKTNETTSKRYVIIGAGIAGVSAAESIHKTDPNAAITLISNETEPPYFRMNLTRYLAGELDKNSLDLHNQAWYQENQIDLRLGATVTDLLPDEKQAILADGSQIPYDTLILTTGAAPFVPPFPGSDLPGVQTVRTIHDANIILDTCQTPVQVVCIGGGLLGLEVAGAIARRGVKVTVLESLAWLLPRQLDQPASQILQKKIEDMGISVVVGARTQALVGESHVSGVQLEEDRLLPADLVVISAGVTPNIELARKAGLELNRGVLVDDQMRTSNSDVYAAGDVAEHHGRLYGLWAPAKSQGSIAGFVAAGKEVVFAGDPPSARLKVLGIDLFSIGQFTPQDENDITLTEEVNGSYASFVFRQDVLIGSILLGDASLAGKVKSAVDGKKDFSTQLSDGLTAAGLKELLKG
ncbi:MAG: FAD-dependent oxidoreductase [Anaerolineaceae bacterium]